LIQRSKRKETAGRASKRQDKRKKTKEKKDKTKDTRENSIRSPWREKQEKGINPSSEGLHRTYN
jgi:hypothetical protein